MNITSPTLLLDEQVCKNNIQRMVYKFRQHNILLRPHFKTHQSHRVGHWFRGAGIDRITVSSLKMAAYFADDHWKNITVALPVNPFEFDAIDKLADEISLNLCVVEVGTTTKLADRLTGSVGILIEIDNGYHRTGVAAKDFYKIDSIIEEIVAHPKTTFMGFLSHAGHSYKCRTRDAIVAVHNQTTDLMRDLAVRYRPSFPELIISTGDTPTCSVAEDFNGVDEVRPGNFAFYDVMQVEIGSCSISDVALALACPIVAMYPDRNELVVHGGAVHLSKDMIKSAADVVVYGKVVTYKDGWWQAEENGMYLKSLSQEHGIVHATHDQMHQLSIGDVLAILPIHSCLTADCMKRYVLKDGTNVPMMT